MKSRFFSGGEDSFHYRSRVLDTPVTEGVYGGGPSPMFSRSSVAAILSSEPRCGDPEALLSPERFNQRR